jgi:hypothetical protein
MRVKVTDVIKCKSIADLVSAIVKKKNISAKDWKSFDKQQICSGYVDCQTVELL